MKAVELSFEEEKLIRTEWVRKDEVEDFLIDCAHFYDHETIVVMISNNLGLDYKRLKIDMWDRRLKTQGNPQWYCKH